ncbi:MAG: glycosyltransferase family 2 protein [Candidatus Krumholzibacteriota bacterium]|nr:glycosyltransferase family 2 protein [Candidatus Krumholzibacteriota bacterium]
MVIVNWNTGGQLRDCVASIPGALDGGVSLRRVVVVDNASIDGSDQIDAPPEIALEIVRNEENRGFAAACNQGARGSVADLLLFLNPDTRLLADSLSVPVAFLSGAAGEQTAVVGITLLDEAGRSNRACARFPTPPLLLHRMLGLDRLFPRLFPGYRMEAWDHAESRDVDQVTGAFFLVRRAPFEAAGGFDERFFVYMEELDLSLRLARAGWRSRYLAEAAAFHRGGGASGSDVAARLFYGARSRILYAQKHFGGATAAGLLLAACLLEPAARFAAALARRDGAGLKAAARGYTMLWRDLPRIVAAGRQTRPRRGQAERNGNGCGGPAPRSGKDGR